MTRQKPITKKRLQHLLDAYGSRVSHWPAAEKAAAERYLIDKTAQDDHADGPYSGLGEKLTKAKALDSWLQTNMAQPAPASDTFLERLIALSDQPQATSSRHSINGPLKGLYALLQTLSPTAYPARAAILGVAFAAGLWIGAMGGTDTGDEAMDLSPWLMGYDLAFYEETME